MGWITGVLSFLVLTVLFTVSVLALSFSGAGLSAAKTSSASGSLIELVLIVAVALGRALGIQAFLVKPYRIPSASMVPTLATRPGFDQHFALLYEKDGGRAYRILSTAP